MISQVKQRKNKEVTPNQKLLWDSPLLQPLRVITRLLSPSWLACIPLTALIVVLWHTAAAAQGVDSFEPPQSVEELTTVLDSIFLTIAAVLVIFMHVGFAMLEAGFSRQKNTVNILAKNILILSLGTIAYWAIGFAFMYGQGNPFIGLSGWFLSGGPETYGQDPYPASVPVSINFLFQVAFAATAATIVSGAVAERIRLGPFMIFTILLVGISYPITGHWGWAGDGWLATMGFSDFAGSTLVHSVGGWAALVGAAILGPREGKYREDGGSNAIPGHNMALATLGGLILWIGWFGFNPGSELAATANVPYIAVTTNLAAGAGAIAATLTSWGKDGKPDLSMIINGFLAGLVSITAPCAGVTYLGAIIIGAIGGFIVVLFVTFIERMKIDDPVGAISVHLVCGVWGTLSVAIFNPELAGLQQFGIQIVGIAAVGAFTVVLSAIFWSVIKAIIGIRVSVEEEIQGLDIGEHAMEAYSGFVKEADVLTGGKTASMSSRGGEFPRSSET
ncbi:MAG: ammonium transporter [Cyanobacteria bacterium SW_9_44_58]|nr:MAG: ammonium transporter [Cyanobacteria bacterium SW_9_44_58]